MNNPTWLIQLRDETKEFKVSTLSLPGLIPADDEGGVGLEGGQVQEGLQQLSDVSFGQEKSAENDFKD